jgi:hypothetical protein
MKPITNYVCTLEQADKLWQLGINEIAKESLFVWVKGLIPQTEPEREGWTVANMTDIRGAYYEAGSIILGAFTSGELIELIFNFSTNIELITKFGMNMNARPPLEMVSFLMTIHNSEGQEMLVSPYAHESQALAGFLIYLLEQKK